ncbi:cob(I)yrinic acid a,c-diamide adenosyltransferase [Bacillus sp. CGMCC 1.16541]|uniref:cob(I)yrinic acid a,c-diamide adenosyltransferase n=1 Tax=Bacillus sp. CGMCC 1.16541 TaxID=2185143 RepID=UPI000D73E1C8|nr:cob(I)yrinic acid a,c-diamide adenosyltransferase [Bacillus sp. CGMCC 1.16541]
MAKVEKGMTLVYTGDGKGKTTAAFGLALRSIGRGLRVKVVQFIKSPRKGYGEQAALIKLGAEVDMLGIGFTWTKTPEEHRQALKLAWAVAKETTMSGKYDLVVLDELNNALAIERFQIDDILPLEEVVNVIKNRPQNVHLVITGRGAKQEIVDVADLVSVIEVEKHYYDEGVNAIYGLEY